MIPGGAARAHARTALARVAPAGLTLAALLLAGAAAAADPPRDPAAAEALFAEGKRLMAAKKIAEACAKFEESNRLDPGVGALLNLAACEEQRGRVASAWGHYRDAEAQLRRIDDPRRAEFARGRAAALEPRLPRVVITVGAMPDGFTLTRDGVKLSAASMGTELPIDPGPHELLAEAPGHLPRTTTFTVKERQVARVVLDPLEPAPGEPAAAVAPTPPTPPPGDELGDPGATQRLIGFVVGGAGLASLAVGGSFVGLTAAHTASADDGCPTATTCSAAGYASVEDARTTALVADVTLVAGAALTAAGVVLVLTAPSAEQPQATSALLRPMVGRGAIGIGAAGAF